MSVASITTAGREIRDTGLDTSTGRDVDDVVITLTENVTSIQGTVRGDGAAGAAVIVFPVERARWVDYGWDPILIASKAADSNGAFLVKGLPEGDYFAVAVDGSQHDAWTDPKFLEAASAVATRIALKWGDTKSLDLAGQQGGREMKAAWIAGLTLLARTADADGAADRPEPGRTHDHADGGHGVDRRHGR